MVVYNGEPMKDEILISAAVIVKNEEDVIERCCDVLNQFCDEIVIFDTGSTDRTKEIAASRRNVTIYESEHFNSGTHFSDFRFGVAKNEAIRKCHGKWVIWWDADDFIDQHSAGLIRQIAVETEEVALFTFQVEYGPLTFEHCRLFRNGAGIEFDEDHSCHEYLTTLGNPNHSRRDVKIMHLPGTKRVSSSERNVAIMEKDHFERGMSDQRTLFYLANGYKEAGRHQEAVEFYGKYLDVSGWEEERFFARYFMGQSLVVLGNYEGARKQALLSLTEDFRFAETYCLLGDLAFKEGDFERAQAWYQMAAATPVPTDSKLFMAKVLYSEYPMSKMSECHQSLVGGTRTERPEPKKTEYTADIKEVMGSVKLPIDPDETIAAASALAALAAYRFKVFEVKCDSQLVSDIVAAVPELLETEDECLDVTLPDSLNGRHRTEWYCRAAGHVVESWGDIIAKSDILADEIRRTVNASPGTI